MAMLRGVRCVLFDLDGTLIDSAADLGRAADDMRIARGLPSLPISDYRASAGSGARGMLGVAFGVTPADDGFTVLRDELIEVRDVEGFKSVMPKGAQIARAATERSLGTAQEVFANTVKTNEAIGALAKGQFEKATAQAQAEVEKVTKTVSKK